MEAAPSCGINRPAHSGAQNTVSRGATPFFNHSVMEAAPSWGTNRLPHSGARNVVSTWAAPLAPLAPETHCPRGATTLFIHSVMEAALSRGTNRLEHSNTQNALSKGAHPLFHSFRHGSRPLVGNKEAGALWCPKRSVEVCQPLFHSIRHGGRPLVGHKQAGALWRLKSNKTAVAGEGSRSPQRSAHNTSWTCERERARGRVNVVRVGRGATLGFPQVANARGRRCLTRTLRFFKPARLLGSCHHIGPILAIRLLEPRHHVNIHLW